MKKVDKKSIEATYNMFSQILHGDAFIIWDAKDNELVTKVEPYGFTDEFGLRINQVVLYSSDSSIDNGFYDSADYWKEKIKRYKILPVPTKEWADILNKFK